MLLQHVYKFEQYESIAWQSMFQLCLSTLRTLKLNVQILSFAARIIFPYIQVYMHTYRKHILVCT